MEEVIETKRKYVRKDSIPNRINTDRYRDLFKQQGWNDMVLKGIVGVSTNSVEYYLMTHERIRKEAFNNLCFAFNISPEYLTGDSDEIAPFTGDFMIATHNYLIPKYVTKTLDDGFCTKNGIPKHIMEYYKSGDCIVTENMARRIIAHYLCPLNVSWKDAGDGRLYDKNYVGLESKEVTQALKENATIIDPKTYKQEQIETVEEVVEPEAIIETTVVEPTGTDNSIVCDRIFEVADEKHIPLWLLLQLTGKTGNKILNNKRVKGIKAKFNDFIINKLDRDNEDHMIFINNIAWVLGVDTYYILGTHNNKTAKSMAVRMTDEYDSYLVDLFAGTKGVYKDTIMLSVEGGDIALPDNIKHWLYTGKRRVNKNIAVAILKDVVGAGYYKSMYKKTDSFPYWIEHLTFSSRMQALVTDDPIDNKSKNTSVSTSNVNENVTKSEKEEDEKHVKKEDSEIKAGTLVDGIINKYLPRLNDEDLDKLKEHLNLDTSNDDIPVTDMVNYIANYPEEDIIWLQQVLESIHPSTTDKDDNIKGISCFKDILDSIPDISAQEANYLMYRLAIFNNLDDGLGQDATKDFIDGISKDEAIRISRAINNKYSTITYYSDIVVNLCKAIMQGITSNEYSVYPIGLKTEPTYKNYVLTDNISYFIMPEMIKEMEKKYNKVDDNLDTSEIIQLLTSFGVATLSNQSKTIVEVEVFGKKFVSLNKDAISIVVTSGINLGCAYAGNNTNSTKKVDIKDAIANVDPAQFINDYLPTLDLNELRAIRGKINTIDPPKPMQHTPRTTGSIIKDTIPNADIRELTELYIAVNKALPHKYKMTDDPAGVIQFIKLLFDNEVERTISGINNNTVKKLGVNINNIVAGMTRLDQQEFNILKQAIIDAGTPQDIGDQLK